MNRQDLRLPGYLSKFYPALIGCLMVVLLMVFSPAQAKSPVSPMQVVNGFSPIELTRPDIRYGLASLNQSSGFIPAPEGLALDNAPDLVPQEPTFGLDPNFRLHHRYWLYTRIENNTENSDWVLHISNFGFLQPRVLIRDGSGQTIKTFSNSGYVSGTDINTIGRAVKVRLPAGKSYLMVVELKANHTAWHPYIALMSDHHYDTWKTQQDFAYKLAVGMILGLILLGLICWLLTRETAFFWASLSALLQLAYYLEHSSIPAILWQSTYEKTALFWLLIYSTMLSQLAFAGSFLKLNRNSGKWYYAFSGAALTTLFLCIASLVLPFQVNMGLAALSYLIVSLVILGSGVAKVRTEGSYYIIYLLGWFPMVLSILQVAWVTQGPRETLGEVTVSYKMIHVLYIQILHMFLHTIALILLIRALREEKLRAEYISQAKSRFIAQSSHDLSQPLNSMSIFLEYLKPHIQGLDGKNIFDRLKNTHRQMSESFKSIMDLSKLESGTIRPELKPGGMIPPIFLLHQRGTKEEHKFLEFVTATPYMKD